MISYRVKIQPDGDTFLVTSPDFPELTTFGDTVDDALGYAVGAFEEAIEARIAHRKPIPSPSKGRNSDHRIALPLQAEVKIILYQSMFESGVHKAELARKMHLHRQEVDRLLNLNHATGIGKIESAFAALGKQLKIEVADAD